MAAYLTKTEAEGRLSDRYGVDASVFPGDLDAASDALDAMAPFIGRPIDEGQAREFPRAGGFGPGVRGIFSGTPDPILDWVALTAYALSTEHEPGVRSEGAGRVNVSYSEPKRSQLERRMDGLIDPYLLRIGSRA